MKRLTLARTYSTKIKTSTATLGAGDIPTLDSFRKVVLSMKKNFVRPAKSGDYVAMISPSVAFDLLDDPKFQKSYNTETIINRC